MQLVKFCVNNTTDLVDIYCSFDFEHKLIFFYIQQRTKRFL